MKVSNVGKVKVFVGDHYGTVLFVIEPGESAEVVDGQYVRATEGEEAEVEVEDSGLEDNEELKTRHWSVPRQSRSSNEPNNS